MEKMEKITIRLNYCLADHEIQLANIDKLKLIIYLCEIKLEKGINLPFKEVTVIGTDYISDDYTLTKALKRVVDQSRKVGVVFNVWEKWEQKESDFSDRKHNVTIVKAEQSIKEKSGRLIKEYHIVFKSNKSDINHNLCVTGSLLTAKKYAAKNIPESLKHLDELNIEIYCSDFSKNEPIATKHGSWLPHPLLRDFDFWDFSGNSGY